MFRGGLLARGQLQEFLMAKGGVSRDTALKCTSYAVHVVSCQAPVLT